MIKNVSTIVQEMAEPIAKNLGLEIVDVEYGKKSNGMNLNICIYKPDGITLEDCENMSKALDEPLDTLNPTKGESYTLNVSSMGLDRPIKNQKDAKRVLNSEVEVKLYVSLNGIKQYSGILTEATETGITLLMEDNQKQSFQYNQIALCTQVIKF